MNKNSESLRPKIKYNINIEFEKLKKDKILPWYFFHSGLKIKKFGGGFIQYSGIEYTGSPIDVFWGAFIDDFLKDMIDKKIKWAIELAQEYNISTKESLLITKSYLISVIDKTYYIMQDVDRKLRGKGFPQKVKPKDVSFKIKLMESFLNQHIDSAIEYSAFIKKENKEEWLELCPNFYGVGVNLKILWNKLTKRKKK